MFKKDSYKKIIEDIVQSYPKKGRGLYSSIANHLKTSSVVVSQIFKANKDLTLDQAYDLTCFFNFTEIEQEYFLLLVGREKCATHKLKMHYEKKIKALRKDSENLKKIIGIKTEFPEEAKQIFYSDWSYAAFRMAAALPEINNTEEMALRFKKEYAEVKNKIDFLIAHGLIKVVNGKLDFGIQSTHLENTSPLLNQHRQNWRLKGISKMGENNLQDLFYVGPMVLSESLAIEIRAELLKLIKNATKKIGESNSEKTYCLNIDFFSF
jgi:hypothetical protein